MLKDVIAQVKEKADIVSYLTEDGLSLRTAGAGKYKCCCPFHQEKEPSFYVDENFQSYHCFGCGEKGDIFSYVQKRNGLDFISAVTFLAEKYQVPMQEEDNTDFQRHKRVQKIVELTEQYFRDSFAPLPKDHPAKEEITRRGLSLDTLEPYFGYAPKDSKNFLAFLNEKGYTKEEIKEAGILSEKGNFLWSDRLIFFIHSYLGKPLGFTGRTLVKGETKFKYVNSKEGFYHKDKTLYGIDIARKKAREDHKIYVVEGQFDVVAMHEAGLTNTVASSGTAFSKDQVNLLLKCVGENGRIVLMLDGDSAGQKAMIKIFNNYPELHFHLDFIDLTEKGKKKVDPCEFLQTHTVKELPKESFFLDHVYQTVKEPFDLEKEADKIKFAKEVKVSFLDKIKDEEIRSVYTEKVKKEIGLVIQDKKEACQGTKKKAVNDTLATKLFAMSIRYQIPLDLSLFPKPYQKVFTFFNEQIRNIYFDIDELKENCPKTFVSLIEESAQMDITETKNIDFIKKIQYDLQRAYARDLQRKLDERALAKI